MVRIVAGARLFLTRATLVFLATAVTAWLLGQMGYVPAHF